MKKSKKGRAPKGLNFNLALLAILFALSAAIVALNPGFLKFNYLMNVVVKNIVEIGLMALPVTMIVITGGIDLSVGSIMILSCVAGGLAAHSCGAGAGILVSLSVGLACGLLNGIIVAKLKISALVTTLATMFLFRGLAKGITAGDSVYAFDFAAWIGNAELWGMPLALFLYLPLALLFALLLQKTPMGRRLYAIGLNPNTAKFSGIDVDRLLLRIYCLSGLICALASFIYLGRFTSVKFDVANSMHLKVVTVIVLGGTSINGGIGDMRGSIIATFIIAVLNSGLTVLNIPIDVQTIIHGSVLVLSLIIYALLNARMKKNRIIDVLNAKRG